MPPFLLVLLSLLGVAGLAGRSSSSSSSNDTGSTPAAKKTDDDNDDTTDTGGGSSSGPTDPIAPAPNVTPPPPPTQDVDTSDGGGVETTPVSSSAFSVAGGRVTTLTPENSDDIASIRILEGPDHGHVTVNPDNTLALVMSTEPNFTGRIDIRYEVTNSDGSTEVRENLIDVARGSQDGGWGQGRVYMLETDENDDVIIETGANHREVYISGSNDALSLSDIAALEGISVEDVNWRFLVNNSEYGSSPDMALDAEAGMQLWSGLTGRETEPSSHWLLFERGYEYDGEDLGRVIDRGTVGESELTPIHVTSYGTGNKPVLNTEVQLFQEDNINIAFTDVAIGHGFNALDGANIMLHNVDITNPAEDHLTMGVNARGIDGFTVHNSSITDVYARQPDDPNADRWDVEFTSGIHVSGNTGLLIEGTLFDHNGWGPDYDPDFSTTGGMPPTMFNHNIYIQDSVDDFTMRDNIIMRGASIGAKLRPGGHFEDNLLLDNNLGITMNGGIESDSDGYRTSTYTLFADNVITSAGNKLTNGGTQGATSRGIDVFAMDATLLDNIVTHRADPNNPEEQAWKQSNNHATNHFIDDTPYYDDTIVYNWDHDREDNTDGLNEATLNATTIQRFTQQLLNDPNAGIEELADYLMAQHADDLPDNIDADTIIEYFQSGFGLAPEDRTEDTTLRFVPNDLGDGIRWDNRLNWDTDDLPGTVEGDSVDLGGNWVSYGSLTSTIQDLNLGEGGTLNVTGGRLNIEDHTAVGEAGGTVNVSYAGQLWMDGYTDRDELDLNIDGGRFVNTGIFNGLADIDITDGQVLLADGGADFIMRNGTRLEIHGDDAQVGFGAESGSAPAVMMMDTGSDLVFTAEDGEIGQIGEIQQGRFEGNVQSGVNLGGGELELNISSLANGTYTLIDTDEIIGEFGEVDVNGLGGGRNATINVDYTNDRVQLVLSSGDGRVNTNTTGSANDAQANDDLWAALTNGHGIYSDDPASSHVYEEDDMDEVA